MSSSAVEVAVMTAVTRAFEIALDGRDTALLCQKVENLVVGAPCGVMDQMTAVFGERDRLMLLLCQPAEIKRMIALPPRLRLWGLDSGIRHSVVGADYGSVRAATFAGFQIISDLRPNTEYLADISPTDFENADLFVELVRREGPAAGLFGAKITGGGSGGTVAVLGDQTSRAAIERVVASYVNQTGHHPYIFTGSSSGSLAFGHLRLRPQLG